MGQKESTLAAEDNVIFTHASRHEDNTSNRSEKKQDESGGNEK